MFKNIVELIERVDDTAQRFTDKEEHSVDVSLTHSIDAHSSDVNDHREESQAGACKASADCFEVPARSPPSVGLDANAADSATTVAVDGGLESLLDRYAKCEAQLLRQSEYVQFLESRVEELTLTLDAHNQILKQLALGEEGRGAEAKEEASTAIFSCEQDALRHMEATVKFHASTIAALEKSNILLRKRVVQLEELDQHQMSELQVELENYRRAAAGVKDRDDELRRRRDEILHLTQKLSAVQAALTDEQYHFVTMQEQNRKLQLQIHEKDQEILSAYHFGVAEVRASRLFRSLNGRWYGFPLQRAASLLDMLSMAIGRFLRCHAWIRICVTAYLLLLHVLAAHIVTLAASSHPISHAVSGAHAIAGKR
jgi:hypothetical protein